MLHSQYLMYASCYYRPAHVGITGNEVADKAVKATSTTLNSHVPCSDLKLAVTSFTRKNGKGNGMSVTPSRSFLILFLWFILQLFILFFFCVCVCVAQYVHPGPCAIKKNQPTNLSCHYLFVSNSKYLVNFLPRFSFITTKFSKNFNLLFHIVMHQEN